MGATVRCRSQALEHGLSSCGTCFVAHGMIPRHDSTACGIFPDQGLNLCPLIGRWTLTTGKFHKPIFRSPRKD